MFYLKIIFSPYIAQMAEKLNLSFADKQFKQSLQAYSHIINALKVDFPKALKLEGETPIFLDTNVILSIYEISFEARENFKNFYKKILK